MKHRTQCCRNSIGKKAVVAATGFLLFLFVVVHMLGNLKTFLGSDSLGVPEVDIYARFLRTVGSPAIPYGSALWTARVILLVCICAHIVAAVRLAALNRAARPAPYVRRTYIAATSSARWMLWSGLLLIVFIVVHILHFTTGTIDITPIRPEQVYSNMYHAFSVWYIVLSYILGMLFLAWHLYHGVWSQFQTLGLDSPDRNRMLRCFATGSAVLLLIGFCAVPISFWLGLLPAPTDIVQSLQQTGAP